MCPLDSRPSGHVIFQASALLILGRVWARRKEDKPIIWREEIKRAADKLMGSRDEVYKRRRQGSCRRRRDEMVGWV